MAAVSADRPWWKLSHGAHLKTLEASEADCERSLFHDPETRLPYFGCSDNAQQLINIFFPTHAQWAVLGRQSRFMKKTKGRVGEQT